MKHIKAILATLVTMVGISACNSRNISSDSSMESTTNHSQSSLADSEITSSIDKDDLAIGNETEIVTNAEESAESFIKSYYECISVHRLTLPLIQHINLLRNIWTK